MPEHKKQHTVPQMLQRCFSLDHLRIGRFHIKTGDCRLSVISDTAQKDWYYKANDSDRVSIELAYQDIETATTPILQRLQGKDFKLNNDEIEWLFFFVVAQLMRTPKAAQAMGAVLDFCMVKDITLVCDEVDSGIRNKKNLPMQASISIPKVMEYLSGKGYLFVWNDTNEKFLLSDNPACLFSPVAEIAEKRQITDKLFIQAPFSGYLLYLPLGPSVGFLCFDNDYYDFPQEIYIDATEDDVNSLNALEVASATDIIMYQDGTFSIDSIKDALDARKSEKNMILQDSIYTPIGKSFSLTGLNLDEDTLIYKINLLAIEKPVIKNPLIGI